MAFTFSGFSDEIDADVVKQFEHLNRLGINYFEPRGINGKNISELSDDEVEELLKNMKKYNIKVSSIGSPIGKIGINDDFDEHLKILQRVIDIAKRLNTKYIRVFSFYIPDGENFEQYTDTVIYRMKKMTELATKNNIVLLHENEKGIYGNTALRCKKILDEVSSKNLRAVFDPANFIQCEQKVYPYSFDMIKPYIEYLHIKDALVDGTVVPAGYGVGNIKELLIQLKMDNYDGFVSLEPHLGTFKGLENLEEGDEMLQLDASTADKFTLAYNSLKKIIDNM